MPRFPLLTALLLLPALGGCYFLADLHGDLHEGVDAVHIVDTAGEVPEASDPITIRAGRLTGNRLRLDVEHSGGCAEHDYALYGTMPWSRSIPPIAYVYLRHDANGDACEALVHETLTYDLSDLKHRWRQTYDYRGPVHVTILPIGSDESGVTVQTTL